MDSINLRALGMEFIGTFSLIFIGGWSVFAGDNQKDVLVPALAHAAILGVFVFIGAKISGGHYNPADTVGLAITNNIQPILAACYIVVQLLGSLAAGFCILYMKPGVYKSDASKLGFPHLDKTTSFSQGMLMEFFGTFYLVFTIYACAVHRKVSPGACALLIGTALFAGIAAFGSITGGALNPARTFGPSILAKSFLMKGWWVYYLGPLLGGITAALGYEFLFASGDYQKLPDEDIEGATGTMEKEE